ncbi:MAG TPA: glutathione S-transferase family protein [Allosphingosinicella sp.]|nr:glutathione S-transferase family protein [Allosphingosinicella sp.]
MLKLYYHPFASFCHKALIALYEKNVAFEPAFIDLGDPEHRARLESVWPMMKFPVLRDEEAVRIIPESSLIIEYLDEIAPDSPRMIPEDPRGALQARLWDRFFDNFVAVNVTKVVADRFRPEGRSDPHGVAEAEATIRRALRLFEREVAGRQWAIGNRFSLADCAAAPALFYAGTIVPLGEFPHVQAYFARLLERPSFARVVEEARPYRSLFPLPWPDSYR